MEILSEVLPVLLYALGAVLLVYVIVLVIKLIKTVDKVNVLLDDIEGKSQQLNGLFYAIDNITDTISSVNDSLVQGVTKILGKLFNRKVNKKVKENNDNE